jgi:hypothetical protein
MFFDWLDVLDVSDFKEMILIIDMSNLEINISFYQVSTSKEQSNNPGAKPLSGLASLAANLSGCYPFKASNKILN